MLHGEVERRSRNVATGDVVVRVDAFDVGAEVSVEKMRGTTSVVTFEDHYMTCRNVAGEHILHIQGFLAVTFIKNAEHGLSIHCYICSCNFEGS